MQCTVSTIADDVWSIRWQEFDLCWRSTSQIWQSRDYNHSIAYWFKPESNVHISGMYAVAYACELLNLPCSR